MHYWKMFGCTAAVAVALACATQSAVVGAPTPAPAPSSASMPMPGSTTASDRNLAAQIPVVDRSIDMLQAAREDYGGHRVAAIKDLNAAQRDLAAALRADNQGEGAPGTVPSVAPEPTGGAESGSQASSNDRLRDVRAMLRRVINNLQADNHDYGGFRVKAIADVRAARDQISDALGVARDSDDNAGGMPGNPGQPASDRNIAQQMRNIDGAVDTLQRALEDYGGHRVAAINDLNQARTDLAQALRMDNHSELAPQPIPNASPQTVAGAEGGAQGQSNDRVTAARTLVQQIIDNLQRDNHDYGGFRVKAIAQLQAAHGELDKALATVQH